MSHEYAPYGESSKAGQPPQTPEREGGNDFARPNFMTVGSGHTSEYAQRLTAMLDHDSGYGSSIGDSSSARGWDLSIGEDRPTPPHTPDRYSNKNDFETQRRTMDSHVHQLHYNHNRTTLGRAISRTMETLRKLQEYNKEWPAHYPSVQVPESPKANRPGLLHTQSSRPSPTFDNHLERFLKRPQGLKRAETSLQEHDLQAESSAVAAKRTAAEPRLITPQLAREFSVLKIDLKMDGLPQAEIIHSLRRDSKALAQLLDGQIGKSVRHLIALRERIEDTSSKVLVTGDLNAGKSTFCNALLRRKILPEDEQPCTSIFCEVLDVRDNAGVEEVHAIPLGAVYDRNNESTYHVYELSKLEEIVSDNDHYSQCKVYIKDIRSVDQSLLNNGVLDIALIDAPGLNNDSIKTTAVFARQEEIDVVVFVVSAANHFTLSAREFIYDAAREKAFMFMVVNGFDNIKNKQRCQEQILKQVAHLSPATFKESSELVHFVSSNAVPVAPIGGSGGSSASGSGSGSGGSSGDPYDSDNENSEAESTSVNDKGKGKDRERIRDFEQLESSLRRFVLEKRARSKLAPAKTYLMNLLGDVHSLAEVNRDVAQSELDRVSKELQALEPVFEQSKKARNEASNEIDQETEETTSEVYSHTRETLNSAIEAVSQRNLGVEYPGFWDAFRYAQNLTAAMLQEISDSVDTCEDYARTKTDVGVNAIKSLGSLHLGDAYHDFAFQPEKMLRRKRDIFARQVNIEIEFWDFMDVTNLWERQEKIAGTSMAVTVAGVLGGRLIGGVGWVDGALGAARVLGTNNLRRLIIPGLLATVVLGISYAISSIPHSLPRRLSQKVAARLAEIDFTHLNALRISAEVRKALGYPADHLRIGLQQNFEKLQNKRQETNKIRTESEIARKYFGNLVRESNEIRLGVEGVDLEGPAPGVAAAHAS